MERELDKVKGEKAQALPTQEANHWKETETLRRQLDGAEQEGDRFRQLFKSAESEFGFRV